MNAPNWIDQRSEAAVLRAAVPRSTR